jgi:hypothetical protein
MTSFMYKRRFPLVPSNHLVPTVLTIMKALLAEKIEIEGMEHTHIRTHVKEIEREREVERERESKG